MTFALTLAAASPLIVTAVLIIGLKWPAGRAMPFVLFLTVLLALGPWSLPVPIVGASILQGLVVAIEILFIVFGAVFLLGVLTSTGAMQRIRDGFARLSPDPRIQTVIIAWGFGGYLEGAAGFGTPAAIVAPLLFGMGFPAVAAVTLGLLVQSTPVTFGALGTPIIIGIGTGINTPEVIAAAEASGMTFGAYVQNIGTRAALLHSPMGLIMPFLMVLILCRFFSAEKRWSSALPALPFAMLGGIAFVVPYALTAIFLGPEFPSIAGGLSAVTVTVLAARAGMLVPKTPMTLDRFIDGPAPPADHAQRKAVHQPMSLGAAWLPYAVVGVLLVVTRVRSFPVGDWMQAQALRWENVFDTSLMLQSSPLYLPGTLFVIGAVVAALMARHPKALAEAGADASRVLGKAGVVLIATVPAVRVMINSDLGSEGLASMPVVVAAGAAEAFGSTWPIFAPIFGALGAFVAGSNTVSNLMLALFQHATATDIGLNALHVVALQASGAAAGNMVAVHNVVAAAATVGLIGREGEIMRKTIVPTVIYVGVLGTLGLVLS